MTFHGGCICILQILQILHSDRENIIRILLRNGASIDTQNSIGFTPLHLATFFNQAHAVDLLLKAGASKHIKDSQGRTVLDLAISFGEIHFYQLNINSVNTVNSH